MVPVSSLVAFAVASVVLIAVPGPSVLFVIGRSLALGWRGGVLTVLGNATGQLVQVIAVALGVGVVVAESVVLFSIVKFAGAAYLVSLGIRTILRRGHAARQPAPAPPSSRWTLVRQGALVGATNPKSVVFFVAILPQFVDYHAGNIPFQLALLGAVFLLIALVSDSLWAIAAGWARLWFVRSPRRVPAVEAVGGAMMIGLGGTLALAGSKS
ncbi:LysE family translocator [Arthrobacter sp. NQ7]|uniref:LysE family translocator n=1 Tax=Arthrobacter sp. NQ7 TaxID=3032303 RepID=UPI00240F01FD|nr:LysE family translocator [Arthrobacter sp. NQ7]MDJ0459553.1 LysE family translocator [Arthrobacter sp. NQ7]